MNETRFPNSAPATRVGGLSLLMLVSLMTAAACSSDSGDDGATDAQTASDAVDGTDASDATAATDGTDGTDGADQADGTDSTDGSALDTCESVSVRALNDCLRTRVKAVGSCYADSGSACSEDTNATTAPLTALSEAITAACEDGDYPNRTVAHLVDRLTNACASEADSMTWRIYGGPQGAVWTNATDEDKSCLRQLETSGLDVLTGGLDAVQSCALSDDCDLAAHTTGRTSLHDDAVTAIAAACPALSNLVAISPEVFVERAAHQADCVAAAGLVSVGEIPTTCGPDFAQFGGKRGEWMRVTIDSERFGTQCGDGSDYSFWVSLAPDGQPLDRVFIGLQGGGVCIFEEDCSQKPAGLFTAEDDEPLSVAIASDDPKVSDYANWTRVYLPYCTQDVFAGGGEVEELGEMTVPRFGAVNLRAAVRMVRDVLWKALDAEDGPGFRSDQVLAMFGGWSAGGYGTIYNYHWMLDDLQWPRTTAFPDAGLALDNGELLGVAGLGLVKIPAWGTRAYLPPYCFIGDCAVGPVLYGALSPRLKQVPEQQMMILTNPLDDIQMGDAYFSDRAVWINAMRSAYCETRDLPGINYYFTSVSDESVHVVTLRDELWTGTVDGESMRDWLRGALSAPDAVMNRVEEADFTTAVPGVEPFPCEVP